MKALIFTLISIFCVQLGQAQVMFEIEAPNALRGVYPCMEPNNPTWSSPDLSAVGNWFSDTITVANDGSPARACDSLLSVHQGNFAILRREYCSLSQQLLNVQNAGATGALVIDSVTGRPLSFGSDSLSSQINIPFVIISKDEGDAIINTINSGDTVVVNIGNKQGQEAIDLSMRMDKALWSSFAIYPTPNKVFVDTSFGVWVFNLGQQDVQNFQVEFWVNVNVLDESQYSDSLSLAVGDSLFIPFHVDYSWPTFWDNYADYGYRLHNVTLDGDTLDNALKSKFYRRHNGGDIISRTFLSGSMESTPADYFYTTNASFDIYHGYRLKTTDIICWQLLNLRTESSYWTELYLNLHILANWQAQTFLEQAPLQYFGIGWYWYNGDDWIDMYFESGYDLYYEDTSAVIVTNYQLTTPYRIGFTTDMYHDERRRQEPFQEIYMSEDGILKTNFDPKLTQLLYIEASPSPSNCGWGINENSTDAFQLLPNPATNNFKITSELQVKSVRLVSITGEEIDLKSKQPENRYYFSAPAGIYLVYIMDDQQRTFTKRMIVIP